MAYPVTYEADFAQKRSRLTTFFRLVLAIPHFIMATVVGLLGFLAAFVAWFVLLVTGRWPAGLYAFVAGVVRYTTQLYAYIFLATDRYPPFSLNENSYPVRVLVDPPKGAYSRVKVLFRLILVIPVYIVQYALSIVAEFAAIAAWFVIVVLGRQIPGLQSALNLYLSYYAKSMAYVLLVTEEWPPFQLDASPQVGPGAGGAAAVGSPPTAPERPEGLPAGTSTSTTAAGSWEPPAPERGGAGEARPEAGGEPETKPDPFGRDDER